MFKTPLILALTLIPALTCTPNYSFANSNCHY